MGAALLYKFKSKVAGDVIMTAAVGDRVLRAMHREPAPRGIFEPAALSGLIAALESSIAEDDVRRSARGSTDVEEVGTSPSHELSLRQRAWPLLEMMKKSREGGAEIVWGT